MTTLTKQYWPNIGPFFQKNIEYHKITLNVVKQHCHNVAQHWSNSGTTVAQQYFGEMLCKIVLQYCYTILGQSMNNVEYHKMTLNVVKQHCLNVAQHWSNGGEMVAQQFFGEMLGNIVKQYWVNSWIMLAKNYYR